LGKTVQIEMPLSAANEGEKKPRGHAGLVGSLLLHAALAFVLIYRIEVPETSPPVIPVEVVVLGQETSPSPQPQRQAVNGPQQQRGVSAQRTPPRAPRREPEKPLPPPVIPVPELKKPDALEAKLASLAKLRQPDVGPQVPDGAADRTLNGNGRGEGSGTYSVKDLIRAQIERRWNLRLDELGDRNIAVAVHLVLARDGAIETIDIVEDKRRGYDAVYRSIAISARNAALLSSPFLLPSQSHGEITDVTVTLNTRDVLR
jgi:hypothetical protein